jgi:hypothetical protein
MEKSTCLSQLHIQKAEHLQKVIKRTFLLKLQQKTNIEGNKHSIYQQKCLKPNVPSFILGSCVKYNFRFSREINKRSTIHQFSFYCRFIKNHNIF